MVDNIKDTNNIPRFKSLFGQMGKFDADGKESWNSRLFALVVGFAMPFNFLLLLNCTSRASEIIDMENS